MAPEIGLDGGEWFERHWRKRFQMNFLSMKVVISQEGLKTLEHCIF